LFFNGALCGVLEKVYPYRRAIGRLWNSGCDIDRRWKSVRRSAVGRACDR
jgi:hypothetical protein